MTAAETRARRSASTIVVLVLALTLVGAAPRPQTVNGRVVVPTGQDWVGPVAVLACPNTTR